MNNILTGQIDLNLLQGKIGIGVDKLTEFMSGKGVEIITNWVNLQIAYNVGGIIAGLALAGLATYGFSYVHNRIAEADGYEQGERAIAYIRPVTLLVISVAVLVYSIGGLLAWTIAPEITFVQYFMR